MSGRLFRCLFVGFIGGLLLAAGRGAEVAAAVVTYRELRYDGVVAQSDWYTCGPAAAATLLRHYYGHDVTESDVLRAALAFTEALELDAAEGISALALVRSLEAFGVPAKGYRLTPEAVADYFARGGLPVIMHATRPRPHYVVIVGMAGEYVLAADPSWGRRVETWVEFAVEKGFSGVVLVPVPGPAAATSAADAQRRALTRTVHDLRRLETLGREVGLP